MSVYSLPWALARSARMLGDVSHNCSHATPCASPRRLAKSRGERRGRPLVGLSWPGGGGGGLACFERSEAGSQIDESSRTSKWRATAATVRARSTLSRHRWARSMVHVRYLPRGTKTAG